MSPIQDFYANQVIFLTGFTGFIGKLITEKLLRSCPNVSKIYVLVRPKHNRTLEQRFKDILNSECFNIVKSLDPDFFKKIHLLSGDCNEPLLGLNSEGVEILKNEVTCVFHVAANVRFDVDLKTALYTNVRSVRDLLDTIKEMKNVRGFVYVSTAFSHCPRRDIREEFYDVDVNPLKLLQVADIMDDETLEGITPHLLGQWPNTYVYTKALAEEVIREYEQNIPVSIIRPAIVLSSKDEPMSGWIDGFQGVVGITVGISLGVLRSLYLNKKLRATLVPADFVVNNILAAAWNTEKFRTESRTDRILIYNFTGHHTNTITWSWIIDCMKTLTFKYFPSNAVWYPYFQISGYERLHKIRTFFYHTLFAYLVDAILHIIGKRTFAIEKYRKINKLLNLLSYFGVNSWNFDTSNVEDLWDKLDQSDKEMFNFDMKKLNWAEYFQQCAIGGRIFLLKDPLETIPKAQRKMYLLAVAHYAFVGLVVYFWYWLFSRIYKFIF